MAELDIKCEVSLWEGIVLATQADTNYQPLQWTLGSGTQATVAIEVPEEASAHYAGHSATSNYFVNTTAQKLSLTLKVPNVAENDISRLRGEATSEETFHAHFETNSGPLDFDYQAAEELGHRIVEDIREAANTTLRFVRINYGQHWLDLIPAQSDPQNYLDTVKAKWMSNATWKPLVVAPMVARIPGLVVGAYREYLEIGDWNAIEGALSRGEVATEPYALVSDAKARYEEGDAHIAVLYLNAALEGAVETFLRNQLGSKIPTSSLENVLKENYDRQLNNWVLPLSDELGLDLRNQEWRSMKDIQKLRREAGHPAVVTGISALTESQWLALVRDASSAIGKLTGSPRPKSPPPLYGELQAGTV